MNAPRPDCPDNDVLQELAAGILAPAMAEQTMLHVAECKFCGPTLRQYLREFSEEQSPENIAILKDLQSSNPAWQKKLVRESIGGHRFRWLKLVPATVALAAVIFAFIQGPALLAGFQLHQAQKQVAAAFVERRTTAMRLPSVSYSPYSPFPVVLGAQDGLSVDEVPPSLHDASGAANKNLRAANADPHWLQIQGRALLWEATPSSLEKAEKDFEKARSEGLATPSLEIDLAASYFERDSRAEHPNLQRTLNLLSEVLSKPNLSKDDQASALFNLAIAYEKTQAWDLAVETWEKYLQVDTTSGWAAEARQHLEEGKEKVSARRQQSYSDPSFFLRQVAEGSLRPEDPEQYQEEALTQWLPVAATDKSSVEYQAVRALADVFAGHQDFWWREILSKTDPQQAPAVQMLGNALISNEQGDHERAAQLALQAQAAFQKRRNRAGELAALFQEIYALRSQLKGANCLARAGPLIAEISVTNFVWLRAQSRLERAQCLNFQLQPEMSKDDSSESLRIANQYHFPVLTLRVLGISSSIMRQQKKFQDSWKLGVEGLRIYWRGAYPEARLDQFYAVMLQDSEDADFPYLAEALLRQILDNRERPQTGVPKNLVREGMLHLELSNLLNGRPQEAEKQAEMASARLEAAAHAYPEGFKLFGGLKPLENELQGQDLKKALATLKAMRGLVERSQYKGLTLSYYRFLGDVNAGLGNLDDALSSYESAIDIAELAMHNLADDQARISWRQATDGSYRGVVRALLAQKKDREALERWEQYKNWPLLHGAVSTFSAKGATNDKAPDDGQELPPELSQEVRLIYATFAEGTQLWLLANGRLSSNWVNIPGSDLQDNIRNFAQVCSNPDSALVDVDRQGAKLFSQLLLPVMAELPESKMLVVELDDSLNDLSLEALKSPDGRYFGQKYAIVYSPGIWMERRLRSPEPIRSANSLFLLDAAHSAATPYLPGMEAERDAIAKSFVRPNIVDAGHVDLSKVKSDLATSEIFHYMGHGKSAQTGTSLVVTDKLSLGAGDFTADVLFRSQMVVLAACSTGRGGKQGLVDNKNLVHSFLLGGVPRVVASHWDVDSESTSQLMISFYHHVTANHTASEAMFEARNEVMARHPHPYYWAGFSVTGRVN
jgi:CHAT domain-containing protein